MVYDDKSDNEKSTGHCVDTRQNALAAVTNLGHGTSFIYLFGPLNYLTFDLWTVT